MIHCVPNEESNTTYCGELVVSVSYVTLADAMHSNKPFDCVDCHKALTEGARHSRPPEE